MVATSLEPITFDCVSYLDARVNPFIGYTLEGFVITPYLQWRTEGEIVYIMTEGALKSYNSSLALRVNPITADFKIGGFRLLDTYQACGEQRGCSPFVGKIQAAGLEIFPSKSIRISPAPHVSHWQASKNRC